MTARSPFAKPAQANGRRLPSASVAPLCAETQGRQIVAALVNDAVEEALGLAFDGASGRPIREPKQDIRLEADGE